MKYDPVNEQCIDADNSIKVDWCGGSGAEGSEWRGFKFSHPEWIVVLKYLIKENGIDRRFEIGDLSKNEVKIYKTYNNASIDLHPYDDPELIFGQYDKNILTKDYVVRAIQCLYSFGGKEDIKVNL